MDYAELGLSSSFSFLDGASSPEALIQRATELDIGVVALTDFGGLYGAPRLARAARKNGLRAIVGARLLLAGTGPHRRLSETPIGYQNLCRLLTLGHRDQAKGHCLVSPEVLTRFSAGLICLYGAPPLAPSPADIQLLQSAFSPRHLFVEIQRHLDPQTEARTQTLVALAQAHRLPITATNDVRHARASDKPLQDILRCIHHRVSLDQAGRRLFPNAERRLKAPRHMGELFTDLPEALHTNRDIAERCTFELDQLGYQFPRFPTPGGEDPNAFLSTRVFLGAQERYPNLSVKIRAQLERELHLIQKLDLAGYFLIVWDICRFAKENNILCQGRGSAANSAVCYALGITAVDPIRMNLLFERFLSEERGEWPDIDIDFPSGDKREQVIQYVYKRYGQHGAAMTANVITFRDRSALREAGLALGFPREQIDAMAKSGGRWSSIEDTPALLERFQEAGINPQSHRAQLWAQGAQSLLHHPRHLGQHSGGMVLSAGRLDEVVPIEPASMPNRTVIQWDKDDCAALGMIKVDLLGLGILAALEEAVPLIEQTEDITLDYAHLPTDDPQVFDMLCRADTVGVFQVESRAQMATLPRLKPRTLYDLVIEIALIRPGPVAGQMVHPYLNRRAGREPVRYAHPSLEPILKRTLGVPIFQEQVMRIAMSAAGFSGGEAEELRRAMGFKRSVESMDAIKARLRSGMDARGISPGAQEEIITSITSFALYGFPESHSASFALLAYASAYLKAHHHGAFTCALLNAWPLGFYSPDTLLKDARRHGVRILPIDVQISQWECTLPNKDTLRLGMRYTQGLRHASALRIIEERDRAPFRSLHDLERRCQLSSAELSTLAELGAFATVPSGTGGRGHSRREALWESASLKERTSGLLGHLDDPPKPSPLPEMTLGQRVLADHRQSGMSVGAHPMAFVRPELSPHRVHPATALAGLRDGSRARVAGVVTVRQRPMTAKGFLFITLEDETGFANLIIPPPVFEQHRAIILSAEALWAEGRLQVRDHVVHLKVHSLNHLHTLASGAHFHQQS